MLFNIITCSGTGVPYDAIREKAAILDAAIVARGI